jgi:hypothetical protein
VSPTIKRLVLFLSCAGVGVFTHSPFFLWLGLLSAGVIAALALWKRLAGDDPENAGPAWSMAALFGVLAAGMSVFAIYVAMLGGAAYFIAFACLLPATFFGYIAWAASYFARHGVRHPNADRVGAVFGFLNKDIRRT